MAGILLFGFVSGISLGLFLGSAPAASEISEKNTGTASSGFFSDAAAQDRVQANTLLSNRIRDLEKELAEQKQDQNKAQILADRFDFFKKHHQAIRMQAYDGSLNATSEMADVLGLSKQEQQAIHDHLAQIKSELDKYHEANTTLTKQTANSVTYEIPSDPQAKVLKDKLTDMLSSDIGADRAGLFMDYSDFSAYSSFPDFAGSKKQIDITWTEQNGKPMYTIKNSFFGPSGNQGWSSSTTDTLPAEDQKLLQGN